MHQTTDATTRQNNRRARHMREALQRLEQKADRNTGGIPLAPLKVHKNAKAYDRKRFRNWRMED